MCLSLIQLGFAFHLGLILFIYFFLLANNREQLFRIRPGKRLAADQAEQAAREPFEEQSTAKAEG